MSLPEDVSTLTTPVVVVEESIVDANIAAMAGHLNGLGIAARPHAKTHKIVEIAEKQLDAGADGLTVATIGEAEAFAEAGLFDDGDVDVFIAYPLWLTASTAARLARLVRRVPVVIGVDSAEAAANAARRLADAGADPGSVRAMIEVDSGHRRSGAAVDEVVSVARVVAASGLPSAGVFTFPGHSYAPGARTTAAADEAAVLTRAAEALTAAGFPARVRSGGSSPSVAFADPGALTEARPGVYVFGDAQQWELGAVDAESIALTVHATVVSRHDGPEHRRVILDSGSKILGSDRPAWASGFARLLDHPDARVTAVSEHNATVEF